MLGHCFRAPRLPRCLAFTALLGVAGCGQESTAMVTPPSLVGTWVGTEVGRASGTWTFRIAEADLAVENGPVEAYAGTYTVDARVTPIAVTATITRSVYAPYVGLTTNGIVQVDGNTMNFAANEPGVMQRPTSFTPGNGARAFLLTRQ